jgi:hypothetical protein
MGILSKITGNQPTEIKNPISDSALTQDEIGFLLTCLKDVTIRGEQVEQFYGLVIKLQNQYIEQQPK